MSWSERRWPNFYSNTSKIDRAMMHPAATTRHWREFISGDVFNVVLYSLGVCNSFLQLLLLGGAERSCTAIYCRCTVVHILAHNVRFNLTLKKCQCDLSGKKLFLSTCCSAL
jgi:hypothetical protein